MIEEIEVDLFAGGGGATTGVEAATGRPVFAAVNHWDLALRVHEANHPETKHYVSSVFEVDPRVATRGRRVGLLWMSPDCTQFSNAKGDVPRRQDIRCLADVGITWAKAVRPRIIMLENVREFLGWGPLYPLDHPIEKVRGRPIHERKGEDFNRWKGELEALGYVVEWRVLDASEYGAPTRRKRLFVIARCDGKPIVWPEPTHGPGLLPLHTAAECIDWNIPCPSIFTRSKPLAEKTLWRIAQGLRRYVLESASPFIVKVNHGKWEPRHEGLDAPLSTVTASRRGHAIVAPTLIQTGYGERPGQRPRYLDIHAPLGTLVDGQKHGVCSAWLVKSFGDPTDPNRTPVLGSDVEEPLGTVTGRDHHSLAAVALAKFRGTDPSQPGSCSVQDPLPTISAGGIHVGEIRAFLERYWGDETTQQLLFDVRSRALLHKFGIVTIDGVHYQIVDIGFRMLQPHELLRAQFGRFAAAYDLSAARKKGDQVRLIGNSVPPEMVEQLVRANYRSAPAEREAA